MGNSVMGIKLGPQKAYEKAAVQSRGGEDQTGLLGQGKK
jgi:hypothetical protein